MDDDKTPERCTKWRIPAYKYAYVEREDEETFSRMIDYLNQNGLLLAGAAHDFVCPQTGKNDLFFPIGRLRGRYAEHEESVKTSENGAKS